MKNEITWQDTAALVEEFGQNAADEQRKGQIRQHLKSIFSDDAAPLIAQIESEGMVFWYSAWKLASIGKKAGHIAAYLEVCKKIGGEEKDNAIASLTDLIVLHFVNQLKRHFEAARFESGGIVAPRIGGVEHGEFIINPKQAKK